MGATPSKPVYSKTDTKLQARLESLTINEKNRNISETQPPPAYADLSHDVSLNVAGQWEKELMNDPKNRLAMAAFSSNNIDTVLKSRAAQIADQQVYNIKIPLEGLPVTNQKQSGRCWLFASTNVFRVPIMKKYELKEFQLSQAYLFFWDKLEKANYFLENIMDTLEEPLDSRLLQSLMSAPVNDGGQWDMVSRLLQRY